MSGQNQVGLCHGVLATQLPTPEWIVGNCQKKQISRIKLMLSDRDKENSTIIGLMDIIKARYPSREFEVVLCVPNSLINSLADFNNASRWVQIYVAKYENIVSYVCVGDLSTLFSNEFPSQKFSSALSNIREKVPQAIKVSTMVDVSMLVNYQDHNYKPYNANTPPCNFKFDDKYKDLMQNVVIPHLKKTSTPLFARIIPYFQINPKSNEGLPTLSNYLINDDARTYLDDPSGNFSYKYVYDAMLDSIHFAMLLLRSQDQVPVYVVTGWPTRGSLIYADIENQKTYIDNVRKHGGTPMRPGTLTMNYFYCLVNQDQHDDPRVEWKHFGIVPYP